MAPEDEFLRRDNQRDMSEDLSVLAAGGDGKGDGDGGGEGGAGPLAAVDCAESRARV